jgi:hypothetical protein
VKVAGWFSVIAKVSDSQFPMPQKIYVATDFIEHWSIFIIFIACVTKFSAVTLKLLAKHVSAFSNFKFEDVLIDFSSANSILLKLLAWA